MGCDERELHEAHSTWISAVNGGDLAHLLTLVTDDLVFLSSGQSSSWRDEFSTNFLAAHQQVRIRCVSELEEVVLVGNVAYTRSRDALAVTPFAGGEATQLAGYRITIYCKQPDGRWREVR
jgi:uncharacterized protein (TIGR02246 family)